MIWPLLAVGLLGVGLGLVLGVMAKVWIDNADAEENARREARRRHPGYDGYGEFIKAMFGDSVTRQGPPYTHTFTPQDPWPSDEEEGA